METSILTGKINTTAEAPGTAGSKRLYIKIFLGEFTAKAPRPKKAKVLVGELLVRYSGREWPEKKNGPLAGDEGVLNGIKEILKTVGLSNTNDITWAKEQRPIKETVTIRVGSTLAKEMIDRGMAHLP